jgi:hypothetical protein
VLDRKQLAGHAFKVVIINPGDGAIWPTPDRICSSSPAPSRRAVGLVEQILTLPIPTVSGTRNSPHAAG